MQADIVHKNAEIGLHAREQEDDVRPKTLLPIPTLKP
jgi:hypothetical protein